jgi:hypothetical protein
MTKIRYAIAAAAVLLAMAPTIRADDSVRLLAGTGSLSNAAKASTYSLKGTGPADADTQDVCYWRRWCYGYCAPVCPPVVYAAPVYYPQTNYLPPPQVTPPPPTAPMTYYYPSAPATRETVAVAPMPYPSSRPSIVVGYQGRLFSGTIAIRPGARLAGLARPAAEDTEVMPTPSSNDTFRYDGGPSRTVPMPVPDPVSPTDPVPTTVPALHRVMMERSRPQVNYPAYGEKPAKRPVVVDPLLVKRMGNP